MTPTDRGAQYLDLPALEQLARVKIVRKRGRIAGFAAPSVPVDILWCGTNRPRRTREPKRTPLKPGQFTRGPALFYNRWQLQHPPLPFSEMPPDWQLAPPEAFRAGTKNGVYLGDWNE
jgi:hypothetical protein